MERNSLIPIRRRISAHFSSRHEAISFVNSFANSIGAGVHIITKERGNRTTTTREVLWENISYGISNARLSLFYDPSNKDYGGYVHLDYTANSFGALFCKTNVFGDREVKMVPDELD